MLDRYWFSRFNGHKNKNANDDPRQEPIENWELKFKAQWTKVDKLNESRAWTRLKNWVKCEKAHWPGGQTHEVQGVAKRPQEPMHKEGCTSVETVCFNCKLKLRIQRTQWDKLNDQARYPCLRSDECSCVIIFCLPFESHNFRTVFFCQKYRDFLQD